MSEVSRQLGHSALRNMSTKEIVQARKDGRLDELLANRNPERGREAFVPPGDADQGPRGRTFATAREWVAALPAEVIVELRRAGSLDKLLSGEQD